MLGHKIPFRITLQSLQRLFIVHRKEQIVYPSIGHHTTIGYLVLLLLKTQIGYHQPKSSKELVTYWIYDNSMVEGPKRAQFIIGRSILLTTKIWRTKNHDFASASLLLPLFLSQIGFTSLFWTKVTITTIMPHYELVRLTIWKSSNNHFSICYWSSGINLNWLYSHL